MSIVVADTHHTSKAILLRSVDANETSDGLYSFTFQQPVVRPIGHRMYVHLASLEFPNTFYNITNLNNQFILTEGGVARTCTITPGNYIITDLIIELETLCSSNSINVSVSFDRKVGKLTFEPTTVTSAAVTLSFPTDNHARAILGFKSTDTNLQYHKPSSGATTSLISTQACDLSGGNHSVLFQTTDLGIGDVITSRTKNLSSTLAKCHVNVGRNEMVFYQAGMYPIMSEVNASVVFGFNIRLVNQDSINIDLNGTHWEATLMFSYQMIDPAESTQLDVIGKELTIETTLLRELVQRQREQLVATEEARQKEEKVRETVRKLQEIF